MLGVAFGLLGARGVALSYASILGIPFLESGVYPEVLLVAAGIAVVSCVAAALVPALNSARLAPAVAMHADPNKSLSDGRIPLIERVMGPLLPRSFTFRIPLRNLFRARRRTLYTVLGIAFAMVLSVVTVSMFDSIDYLLDGDLLARRALGRRRLLRPAGGRSAHRRGAPSHGRRTCPAGACRAGHREVRRDARRTSRSRRCGPTPTSMGSPLRQVHPRRTRSPQGT